MEEKKGRRIFVRKPEADEKNANNILIQKGAITVDFNGTQIQGVYDVSTNIEGVILKESPEYELLENKIRTELNGKLISAGELLSKLELTWTKQKLSNFLKNLGFVEVVKKSGKSFYKLKGAVESTQKVLFD